MFGRGSYAYASSCFIHSFLFVGRFVETMAPKRAAAKTKAQSPTHTSLDSIMPTEEELAAAQSVLATVGAGNKRRSQQTAMASFIARYPDTNQGAALSTGDQREDYMLKYLIYQSRKNQARISNKKEHETKTSHRYKEDWLWVSLCSSI